MNGITPRNGIMYEHMMPSEVENLDTLFEICDAEFNSRKDVHENFRQAKSPEGWVRYFLMREVQHISVRDGIYASNHMSVIVAKAIADIWFKDKQK